jgi:hypothetical protein
VDIVKKGLGLVSSAAIEALSLGVLPAAHTDVGIGARCLQGRQRMGRTSRCQSLATHVGQGVL